MRLWSIVTPDTVWLGASCVGIETGSMTPLKPTRVFPDITNISDFDLAHVHVPTTSDSYKRAVIQNINSCHYEVAFKSLVQNSEAARRDLLSVAKSLAKSEIKKITKKSTPNGDRMTSLQGDIDLAWMQSFSWASVVVEAKEKMPTLTNMLQCMFPPPTHMLNEMRKGRSGAKRYK
jgi:hypothetical protein